MDLLSLGTHDDEAVVALHARLEKSTGYGSRLLSGRLSRPAADGDSGSSTSTADSSRCQGAPGGGRHHLSASRTPRPVRLSHVVLNSIDIERSVDFYVSELGTRCPTGSSTGCASSDARRPIMPLRSLGPLTSLSIIRPGSCRMSRITSAQQVGSCDRVSIRCGGQVGTAPDKTAFAYFADPSGFAAEFTTELLTIDDEREWRPSVWPIEGETSDEWGLAGSPQAQYVDAVTGRPDPGLLASRKGRAVPTDSPNPLPATDHVPVDMLPNLGRGVVVDASSGCAGRSDHGRSVR